MKRAILGILCLFLGPVLSLALGFIAYFALDYSYGTGANTEGTATPTQQYYSSIAQPVGASVAVGGVLFSLWLTYLTLPKRGTTVA